MFRVAGGGKYNTVSVQEAYKLLQSGQAKYIDVRTKVEYSDGHPPNSTNIPIPMQATQSFVDDVSKVAPNKEDILLMGCAAGGRSAKACDMLVTLGYTNLLNVEGGFGAWESAGLPKE